jgi:hypothetical protein
MNTLAGKAKLGHWHDGRVAPVTAGCSSCRFNKENGFDLRNLVLRHHLARLLDYVRITTGFED